MTPEEHRQRSEHGQTSASVAVRTVSGSGYGYMVTRGDDEQVRLVRTVRGISPATTYYGQRMGDALDTGELWAEQMSREHREEAGYACRTCSAIQAVEHAAAPIQVRQHPAGVGDYAATHHRYHVEAEEAHGQTTHYAWGTQPACGVVGGVVTVRPDLVDCRRCRDVAEQAEHRESGCRWCSSRGRARRSGHVPG